MQCDICKQEIPDSIFAKHPWREHGITQEQYYVERFPRKDLYDFTPILYKNPEQYLSTDFNSKENFRLWLKNQPKEIAKDYCKKLLIQRKENKKLIYSLSQVELRSINNMPSIITYNNLFNDYYELCKEIGFINKFGKHDIFESFKRPDLDQKIIVDTRETKPITFSNMEVGTLSYGDYCIENSDIFIDRKSGPDFIGTFSNGYARFCREIDRAKEKNHYIIVLVECSLQTCLNFNKTTYFSKKIKTSSDFVFHNVREISQKYTNIQFLFLQNRSEMTKMIPILLTNSIMCKKLDLQLLYEKGDLGI